jgi:hypothetical protein|tara:strand:+ start:328 stop:570 length:243 start_codon:yes stop_codon:yes gene_type:complete
MIYRVCFECNQWNAHYRFYGNQKDALQAIKEHESQTRRQEDIDPYEEPIYYNAEIDRRFKTPKTKQEVIDALNIYGNTTS